MKQSTIVHSHQTNDRCQKEGEFEATSTSYHLTAEDGPHAKPSDNEIVINAPMEIDEVSDEKIFICESDDELWYRTGGYPRRFHFENPKRNSSGRADVML